MSEPTILGFSEELGGDWVKRVAPGLTVRIFHENGYWRTELIVPTGDSWEDETPINARWRLQESHPVYSLVRAMREADKLAFALGRAVLGKRAEEAQR
jgi:hypothetical protein